MPPGLASGGVVEPNETLDSVGGHFRLFQLKDGHRFSTDDVLTAWYGTTWCPSARTALDLGSGAGAAPPEPGRGGTSLRPASAPAGTNHPGLGGGDETSQRD